MAQWKLVGQHHFKKPHRPGGRWNLQYFHPSETAVQVWGWRHSEEAVLNCSAKGRGSVAATLPEV